MFFSLRFLWFLSVTRGLLTPLTNSSGDVDVASLLNHMQNVDQLLINIQSESQVQEQKYAAILSSILSKLTETTDEFAELKKHHNDSGTQLVTFAAELVTVKDELKSTQEKLNQSLTESLHSDCKKQYGLLRKEVDSIKADISLCESNVSSLSFVVRNLSVDVKASEADSNSAISAVSVMQYKLNSTQSALESTISEVNALKWNTSDIHQLVSNNTAFLADLNSNMSYSHDVAFEVKLEYALTGGVTNTIMPGDVIHFDNILYNGGNGYSSSGIFTAPVSGTYSFWIHATVTQGEQDVVIPIWNGHRVMDITYGGKSKNIRTVALTTLFYVEKGKDVKYTSLGTGSFTVLKGFSSMGGVLLTAHRSM